MFCSSCGAQRASGSFCSTCGASFETAQSATQQYAQNFSQWETVALDFNTVDGNLSPRSTKTAEIFSNLGRVAVALLVLGFAATLFSRVLFPGFQFTQLLDFTPIALIILMAASVGAVLIKIPTWGRWLAVAVLSTGYLLVVRPLAAFLESLDSGSDFSLTEFQFLSPIQMFFSSLELLGLLVEFGGWFWFLVHLSSFLFLQIAPVVATIALLGVTLANKKLS